MCSLAGVLSGAGALTKIGAGTLTLTGTNSYHHASRAHALDRTGRTLTLQRTAYAG